MAPNLETSGSETEEWLTLRRNHDTDLKNFNKKIQAATAKFWEQVENEREAILARHRSEEKAFWNRSREQAKSQDSKQNTSTHGQANRAEAENSSRPEQATMSNVKISRYSSTAKTLSSTPSTTNAAIPCIDLCSDTEEQVIPQKKKPFKDGSKASQCPTEAPRFNRKQSVLSRSQFQSTSCIESHAQFGHKNDGPESHALNLSHCGTAVTSQVISHCLNVTKGSKRKVVDISSDEDDSVCSPSFTNKLGSSDEEGEKRVGIKETKKQASRTTRKKARHVLSPSSAYRKEKNSFGFLTPSKPKAASPQTPTGSTRPAAPCTPASVFQEPTKQTAVTPSPAFPTTRSYRKAKLDARQKISEISEQGAECLTEEIINEANEKDARASVIEEVRSGLCSMSITRHAEEDVNMRANVSDNESAEAPGRRSNGKIDRAKHSKEEKEDGWKTWTESRAKGDRYMAKHQASVLDEEDEDDWQPDISKYRIVNGIIVHDDDAELLGLMGSQDRHKHTRLPRISSGSRAVPQSLASGGGSVGPEAYVQNTKTDKEGTCAQTSLGCEVS